MEKISEKITNILLDKKYIEQSMYEIYKYGIMMLFEIMLSFITSIIISCAMGMFIEGIIFLAVFIPIRSYLGGLHMKRYISCFFVFCHYNGYNITIGKIFRTAAGSFCGYSFYL